MPRLARVIMHNEGPTESKNQRFFTVPEPIATVRD